MKCDANFLRQFVLGLQLQATVAFEGKRNCKTSQMTAQFISNLQLRISPYGRLYTALRP